MNPISLIILKGDNPMKMFYEDPTVEVMLLDVEDVITASTDPALPDDEFSLGGGFNPWE